jgi:hypothetical protein
MKTLSTIAISAALLAACGGGDGGGAAPPAPGPTNVSGTDVPVSATQSADAAYDFVSQTAAAKSDSADPIAVGGATLATSETDEPKPL